ncbi:ParA family protein [Aliivibrio fischeri]|uniref:ParA family protein n=1 Tax=Aliivibrio fischeri TaxID=668 RepID=UPI0007C57128|nr:ParA family protein [Aliivibrio fischeri]
MDMLTIKNVSQEAEKSRLFRTTVLGEFNLTRSLPVYSQRGLSQLLGGYKSVRTTGLSDIVKDIESRLDKPFPKGANGHYMLSADDCRIISRELGVPEYKLKGLPAFVLNIQNLKGGVGKSLSVGMLAEGITLSKRFVLDGRRVLVIDLDPQGTTTEQLLPNLDLKDHDMTAIIAMSTQGMTREELKEYAVKSTGVTNLDIIPSDTLDGFLSDELDSFSITGSDTFHDLLDKRVIQPLKYDYDLIILDAGPHLDKVMKNCLAASDGILIPVPPTYYSFDSTIKFIERLPEVFDGLVEQGYDLNKLKFLASFINKAIVNKQDHDKAIYANAEGDLNTIFGFHNVIKHSLPLEDAYERCSEQGGTCFSIEASSYSGSKTAFNRAFAKADEWLREVVAYIDFHHATMK